MVSAVNILMSKVKTDREMVDLSSTNITRADMEGSTRKEAAYVTTGSGLGSTSSVRMGAVHRVIDRVLQREVQIENSKMGTADALNTYYGRLSTLFGTKGGKTSFVHGFGNFMNAVSKVGNDPGSISKRDVIQMATQFATELNNMSGELSRLSRQIDGDIAEGINYINNALDEMLELNSSIYQLTTRQIDCTSLEDERDLHVLKIGEYMGIIPMINPDNTMTLATSSGGLLCLGPTTYDLQYTQGQTTSSIHDSSGNDITAQIVEGKLAGFMELRNTVIPNFMAELDELTRVVRDTVNALHNEGSALVGPSTLTGETFYPGVVGTPDLNTQIVGNGTLRLAVTDKNGVLLDYKDVDLSVGVSDVTSLINVINATNYTISGNPGTANGGGDFTIAQLPTGELQLVSTGGHSVAVGSVNGLTAQICAGAGPFDPTTALGFSHFFGLNNLFKTGNQVYSSSSQTGIFGLLQVNSNLVSNVNYLAVGSLDGGVPPVNNIGVSQGKNDIAIKLSDALKMNTHTFLSAGTQGTPTTTLADYSQRILAYMQKNINEAKEGFEFHSSTFDQITLRANEISGVDPSTELLRIFELATSQQISSKALSIVQGMNRELVTTIAK